jgi:hypothetical protein
VYTSIFRSNKRQVLKPMADVAKTFEPLNDLESALIQAQAGNLSAMDFLGKLSKSKVFVLLDKELPPSGLRDNSASLLVLSNIAGTPVLALFTAPERSEGWPPLSAGQRV